MKKCFRKKKIKIKKNALPKQPSSNSILPIGNKNKKKRN